MSVFFEHFKTLESLIDTIENRKYNKVFARRAEKASQNPEPGFTWYGTDNYNESIDLLKGGYHEPLETLKREVLKIDKQQTHERPRQTQNIVGYAPHVPNAIRGIPVSMLDREKQPTKTKTIHLLYGFSAVGDVDPDNLIKGGANFIALVNSLEKEGFRVKLDLVRCTTASVNDTIGYTVNVKQYTQPLNLLKLCYPLVHPSMLRRTSFKWAETLPDLTDRRYRDTMGVSLIVRMGWNKNKTLACEKEKQFLRDNGILKEKDAYYCNVYEAMEAKSASDLAKKMGLV